MLNLENKGMIESLVVWHKSGIIAAELLLNGYEFVLQRSKYGMGNSIVCNGVGIDRVLRPSKRNLVESAVRYLNKKKVLK